MKNEALSLIEMTVVVAIIALLAVAGIPAIKALYKSFETGLCSKALINSTLSCAKATAQKERNYAGVLFEQKDNVQLALPIIQEPNNRHRIDLNLDENTILFNNEKGRQPVNLGEVSAIAPVYSDNNTKNILIGKPAVVLFSPAGKLVIKDVAIYPDTAEYKSVRAFVIYDKSDWDKIKQTREKEIFIDNLKTFFVNVYTGRIIE